MKSMIWIWSSLSLGWITCSGGGVCVPCGVSWGGAVLIGTSGFVGVSARIFNWINLNKRNLVESVVIDELAFVVVITGVVNT